MSALVPLAVSRPAPRRLRVLRAYAVALRVAASYVAAALVARLGGRAWVDATQAARHRRNGRRLRLAILRLRGLYIKVGQLASVLTAVLPPEMRAELEGFQDAVPAGSPAHVRARLAAELGAPPETLFASFDEAPVASASLAQVHRATLTDGRAVAVKVQHADIEDVARLDLRAIRRIASTSARWFGMPDPEPQLAEVEAVVAAELDFRREADATEEAAQTVGARAGLAVPAVVRERSAARVLTTAWADGIRVGDLAALDAAGIDRRRLAAQIVDAYAQMIFRDGRYHADPHPGNLVAAPLGDGRATLTFLDWGATASLTPEMQRGLAAFLTGILARDASGVTDALVAMGFVPTDEEGAARSADAVRLFMEQVHGRVLRDLDPSRFRLADLSAGLAITAAADARADAEALGLSFRDLAGAFRVPRDWILLERTALLVVGVCTDLDPDLNPFERLMPYVTPLVDGRLGAQLGATLLDRFTSDLRATFAPLFAWVVPPGPSPAAAEAEAEAMRVLAGRLAAERSAIDAAARRIERAARQVVLAVVGVGAGAVGYAAHAAGQALLAGGLTSVAVVSGLALAMALAKRPR